MNKKRVIGIVLLLGLLGLAVLSFFLGVEDVTPGMLLRGSGQAREIALFSRLPRTAAIIITGACMSIAGRIMQAVSSNRFVSPSTAGTMEWCRLGVLLAILCFGKAAYPVKMLTAFACALCGSLFFIGLQNRLRRHDPVLVPLIGMMLGGVVSAVTTFFAYRYDLVQNISSWLLGSFSLIRRGSYELLYLGIPCLLAAYWFADRFTIAGMGEEVSSGLGLNQKHIWVLGLGITAVITAAVTVSVGTIPFLGLMVPNLVSIVWGDHLRSTLWMTAGFGAALLLACDIAGRLLIFPYEVPVSVILSVLGSVVFFYVVMRRGRYA